MRTRKDKPHLPTWVGYTFYPVHLAIIGIIAIGCVVGYLVYRHFSPDYLEDFDDEFEDDEFEDEDFFADEADS